MKSPEDDTTDDDTFAAALRDAMAARDFTLVGLRERLVASGNPVSMATLSYWRSGRSQPAGAASLAAVEEIERHLDLAPAALVDRIRDRVRPMEAPAVPPLSSPVPWERGMEVLDALDSTTHEQFHELSTHLVVDVGADGGARRQQYRVLFQARQGRVTEMPIVEVSDLVCDDPPIFTPLAGCRLGRSHHHDSGQAFGAVLELDHPVVPTETALLEFRVDYPSGFREHMVSSHATTRPHTEVLVWVRFRADDLPTWVERYSIVEESETVEILDLHGTAAHAAWHRGGPGEFGIRWGW